MTLLMSGCVSIFIPDLPTKTSSPTDEKVEPSLQGFYSQVLKWTKCNGSFYCAKASAPMDWSDPSKGKIEIALVKSPATGKKHGSLLVNPGGPGASGVEFVVDSLDYAVDSKLQSNFDIIGFDPRGVGKSTAVSCYKDPADLDKFIYEIVPLETDPVKTIKAIEESYKAFGADCLKYTGDFLGFVDTISAAKDMDMLRAVLGDKKLNYLGYSYGTFLGATYAELFPKNTGKLVLDGALDPATSDFDVTLTQAKGFESAARAYLSDCLSQSGCPFSGTVDQGMKTIKSLLDRLDASPIKSSDGRMLGSGTMFTAIILPLYSSDNWPYLSDLFSDVFQGNADYAFQLADIYNGRDADGTYKDNSTEAFTAINCLDYPPEASREVVIQEAERLAQEAPVFGPQMSYGGTSCVDWPFKSTRVRGPIKAAGSAPILVLGTTNDPATPYQWAVNLAGELENGHLITYKGEGHTAYNKSNSCVDDTVDDFFISGKVPATDPKC
ncbi:MAG: alpha/beta fold hydrolase [Microbacteriaceae bacterium]|nr:alpha/beta fold hydrolase [Microbacteriaceae bacterium]